MIPIRTRTTTAMALPVALWLLVTGCASTPPPVAAPSPPQPTASAPAAGPAVAALPAVQAYVDAVNTTDLDALVAAFAPDGQVLDVSRRISGTDAIRTWADSEVIGGTLRVDEVTVLDPGTQRLRVHWAPGGSGGWAADYTFTTGGNQILVADLQYAR